MTRLPILGLAALAATWACGGSGSDANPIASGDGDGDRARESAELYGRDADGDGIAGSDFDFFESGEEPDGYLAIDSDLLDTDCDDSDDTVYPGAEEICDGKDNDCDGIGDLVGPDCFEPVQLFPGDNGLCFQVKDGNVACTSKEYGVPVYTTSWFPGLNSPDAVWARTYEACALKDFVVTCWTYADMSSSVLVDLTKVPEIEGEIVKVDAQLHRNDEYSPSDNHYVVAVMTDLGRVFRMEDSGTWRELADWDDTTISDIQFWYDAFCYQVPDGRIECSEGNLKPNRFDTIDGTGEFIGDGFILSQDGVIEPDAWSLDWNDNFQPDVILYPGTHGAVEAARTSYDFSTQAYDDEGDAVCARADVGKIKCTQDDFMGDWTDADQIVSGIGICARRGGELRCFGGEEPIQIPAPDGGPGANNSSFGLGDTGGACDNTDDAAKLQGTPVFVLGGSLGTCVENCLSALDEDACLQDCTFPDVSAECLRCVEVGARCLAQDDTDDTCIRAYSSCSGHPAN